MNISIVKKYKSKNACMERQAINAFYQHTLEHAAVNDDHEDIITDKYTCAEDIVRIEKLTKSIANSKEILFTKRTPKMACVMPYIKAEMLGLDFLSALKIDFDSIKTQYPLHTANPYGEIFETCISRYNYPMIAMMGTKYCPEEIDNALEVLNAMIEEIRMETNTKEFKAKIKKFQRTPNKALAGSRKYIERHFDNCSVLCNIRVDLYLNESNYFAVELESEPVSSKESIEFIDAFIAGMEKKKVSGDLFKYCLGYIIKREYGLERGYHFHVMIIYNGHKVQEDIPYAKMIGEYWTKITGGIGTYFNCNKSKFRYKYCGIGKIHYYEEDKLKGIDEALIYITKPDYYIRLASSDNARNFRRGEMPPLRENREGRPRKH